MSRSITHFAAGAALTTLLAAARDPPYPRTVAAVGGVWAMLPDVRHVVPGSDDRLRAFHDSRWANLFWFHRAFDRIDVDDSTTVGAVALGVYLLATAAAERAARRDRPD